MQEYELTRSKRKTIALSISKDLTVVVKAPLKMPTRDIETFVNKHSHWIEKHKILVKQRNEHLEKNILNDVEIAQLRLKAKEILPQRVDYYSDIMRVKPTGVKITSAITRWGSCSAKNSICFSYRLMLLPMDIVDYIVVHELAHIRVKNHGAKFYNEISKYMPDYKDRLRKLKKLQRELPN